MVDLWKQQAWSVSYLIQIYLVRPLCSIFFEQRVTEISYHHESPSTVPKYNFSTTARLWLWYNRGGTFIIPIPRDKFNTSFVILNWPSVRFKVTCWWVQIKLKEASWSIAFIFLMAASICSRPEILQTNFISHNPRAFPLSLPMWNWSLARNRFTQYNNGQ